MPALRGSLTYARFFVEGKLPDDFRERFMRSIRLRAMKPLEPEEEELERSGWVKIDEPMETSLSYDDVFYNEFVVLGFRTDKWKLPTSILKARVREAESAYLQKKGREKMSRREKGELKLMVAKKLRRESAPVTQVVDVAWAMNDGVVRFFSHATKPGAVMTALFEKTFGLRLVPESPYTLATRIGLDKAQIAAWQDMERIELDADLRDDLHEAAEEE